MRIKSPILVFIFVACIFNVAHSNAKNLIDYNPKKDISAPPPANDDCSGALEIGPLYCGFFETYWSDPEATPDSEISGNCLESLHPGQWYTFTTQNSLPYEYVSIGGSPDGIIEIFSSSSGCSGLIYEECIETAAGSFPWGIAIEPGVQYYLLATGLAMNVRVYEQFFYPSCDDPIILTIFGDLAVDTEITQCAPASSVVPCENDHVVWFEYTTTGCIESDIHIEITDINAAGDMVVFPANETSLTVFSDDCSTILSEYDMTGPGYLCNAMSSSEALILEGVPGGTTLNIAVGSSNNNTGYFTIFLEEFSDDEVINDICPDAIELIEGINIDLSNDCATNSGQPLDASIIASGCTSSNSEATVWYEFDPGDEPQDIVVNILSSGIISPAIAAFDGCFGSLVAANCGSTIEMFCIDSPIMIVVASSTENSGTFDLEIISNPSNSTLISNDICSTAESLSEGVNVNLTNECASYSGPPDDAKVPGCISESEATVWYEYDPGSTPQNIVINLNSTGINSPALAVFDGCIGEVLAFGCTDMLELYCINTPIMIEVASQFINTGTFDLTIQSSPSIDAFDPLISGDNICSGEETDITIDIPGGDLVNITVEVSPGSSSSIDGMASHTFTGVNMATINDLLVNTSSMPAEAQYIISINPVDSEICPTPPIEFSIMVYPEFITNVLFIDECLPHILELSVDDLINGGSQPYTSTNWNWNGIDPIGSSSQLSYELMESGEVVLEIIDNVGCTESVTIDISTTEPTTPTFDFPIEYCQTLGDVILFPESSLEGITGSWNIPSIDLAQITTTGFHDIIFTPDSDFCSTQITLSVLVYLGLDPEFDLPDEVCSGEGILTFPSSDLNGVMGIWDIPAIDVSNLSGIQSNTFHPITSSCYNTYEYFFMIEDEINPTFEYPETLCRSDASIVLNSISQEGFTGTWDISEVDPGNISGNYFTSIWTPDEGISPCLQDTTITIEIIDPFLPEFNLPDQLCAIDMNFVFPTIDLQMVSGNWSIPTIDPSNISGTVLSTFTPDDHCVESFEWEIEIIEPQIPEFNFNTLLCSLDSIFILPLVSNNGISGTWSIPVINPNLTSGQQIDVEFQGESAENCVESIVLVIEIEEAIDPIFDLPTKLCWADENLILPTTSLNAIDGIWNPSIIDIQSNVGNTLSSTFLPMDGSCTNIHEQFFEIVSPPEISTALIDPSGCDIEDGSILIQVLQGNFLEFSIDEGANWQSSLLFENLSSGGYTIMVRSTDLNTCISSFDVILNADDGPVIHEVTSMDISSCVEDNGSITIEAEGNNLEFSIDGGFTWQASNTFENLSEGAYIIDIREDMGDCILEVNATISDFPQTEIVDINTINLSDCDTEDGQIEVLAIGNSLEYSIDNGSTWSSQNIFVNLSGGEYFIQVRSTSGSDCFASGEVELSIPETPQIINVEIQNPSSCSPSLGSIEVEAEGINLEFSIDGGLSWQNGNSFINLDPADYQLIVRNSEKINCYDEYLVSIEEEIESLELSIYVITAPSACDLEDGSLEISNSTIEKEYSLDGGITWQESHIFNGLASGIYELVSRKVSQPNCFVMQSIELPDTDCPCHDLILEFSIGQTDCSGNDSGTAELVSIEGMNNNDFDILWQNGQNGLKIEELGEGWHSVTIFYDEECIWKDSVWVELLKPIEFSWIVTDLDCPEANNGTIEIMDVTGGTGIYMYSIDGLNFHSSGVFSSLNSGLYEISVMDNGNCLTSKEVEVEASTGIAIDLPSIEIIKQGESVLLDPHINLTEVDSFIWKSFSGLSDTDNIILEVSPKTTETYGLEIFYGVCSTYKEILIEVQEESEDIFVGNSFSPNGDNINDYFYIQGGSNSTIDLNHFLIYDRWGNVVFQISDPEFNDDTYGWDGRYQDKQATQGVYVYMIKYTLKGEKLLKVGSVTLML